MITGFSDDSFDDFFKNSPAMQRLREMVYESLAPSRAAMDKIVENSGVHKALQIALAPAIEDATKGLLAALKLPSLGKPPTQLFDFHNLSGIKIGDEYAQRLATSIDFAQLTADIRTGSGVPPSESTVPVFDPSTATEGEFDQIANEAYKQHPDVFEKLEGDPALTNLDATQKKMLMWCIGIFLLFGATIFTAWGWEDENVAKIQGVAGSTYFAYQLLSQVKGKLDEEIDDQTAEA